MDPSPLELERRSILLLHVQRTGGMSLVRMLRSRFDLHDGLMAVHGRNGALDPNGFGLVEGHVGLPFARRFRRWPFVVACLRDPVERAISYFYLLRDESEAEEAFVAATLTPQLHAGRMAAVELMRRYDLDEFLVRDPQAAAKLLGNRQAWTLSDPSPPSAATPALDEACRNLERCDLVLLTERLSQDIAWLGERLGCGPLGPMPRDNPASTRPAVADLDPGTRQRLAEITAVDRALYEFGRRLYERRLRDWRQAGSPPEPTLRWRPPPSAADFSFEQAIHGSGWQPREEFQGRWFSWIGEPGQATLELTVSSTGEHRLACEVAHVLDPSILQGVTVTIDGIPVALTAHHENGVVELRGRAPAALFGAGSRTVCLRFSVERTLRPVDVNPASSDRRQLGVALAAIRLIPVAGA